MSIHGDFDHQLKIGSTTKNLRLVKDEKGAVMYNIRNIIPNYRDQLLFTQTDWTGGHGSFERRQPDVYFEGQSIDTTQKGRAISSTHSTDAVGGHNWGSVPRGAGQVHVAHPHPNPPSPPTPAGSYSACTAPSRLPRLPAYRPDSAAHDPAKLYAQTPHLIESAKRVNIVQ